MALDTHPENIGITADRIVISSLLGASSYQGRITIPSGKSTSESVRIVDSSDADEAEEREWDTIVSQPHVRQALRHMAAEARRQYYAGETEEGGFGLE